MIKKLLFLFTISFVQADIIIRPAHADEIEEIIDLDRKVSWEYFKPLFLEYTGLPLAENPDEFLEEDLIPDRDMFVAGINHEDGNRLLIALHNNTIVGFIAFSKEDTTVSINLLLVEKSYRNKKIGKQLLERALHTFHDINACTLIVLDKNSSARKFYESYGFVQQEMPEDIKSHFPTAYNYIYLFYKLGVKNEHNTITRSALMRFSRNH